MRHLVTCTEASQAKNIARFLTANSIETKVEESGDKVHIWVLDEDEYDAARALYEQFLADPEKASSSVPETAEEVPHDHSFEVKLRPYASLPQKKSFVTTFFIVICALLFITSFTQRTTPSGILLGLTPTTKLLLYDYPASMEKLTKMLDETGVKTQKELQALPEVTRKKIESLDQTGYWKGIYFWALRPESAENNLNQPLFGDIRKGEVWRLVSPIFLHVDFLHILFNMLWLFFLGKMVEERVGVARYIGMTLCIAVVSNTLQYVMSGPFFMGYSGVVVGLAGFIWMRQVQAPWEGYPLQRATLIFLMIFVVGMALLQLTSFILITFNIAQFEINIANTAHISGGIVGLLLGRMSLFKRGIT